MADPTPPAGVPAAECTTSATDQEAVAQLKERLASNPSSFAPAPSAAPSVAPPSVSIEEGAHKYVLIRTAGDRYFVTSRRGASYHRNAAEPLIAALEAAGFSHIEVTGGGRLFLQEDQRRISIFGFSYGFGQADHAISRSVILKDPRYENYEITISNDGY